MRRVETARDALSEARKGYFLAALCELHERAQGSAGRHFELTEIAQHASRLDPDYEPRTRFEKALIWFGVDVGEDSDTIRDRERNYLARRGEARRIMKELVETGEVLEGPIASLLILEAGPDYGRSANENGMLYALPEHVLETVG